MTLGRRGLIYLGSILVGTVGTDCYANDLGLDNRRRVIVSDYGALPGGSDATPGVRLAIEALPRQEGAILVFPPGIYRFHQAAGVVLRLEGIADVLIDGSGVLLIFEGAAVPFFFRNCPTLSIIGVTVDWGRPPFSQGDVIGVTPDLTQADIRIDPEFPIDGHEPIEALATYDRARRLMALRGIDAYNVVRDVHLVANQVLRLVFTRPIPLSVGETVVLRHQVYRSNVFTLSKCSDVRFTDVVVNAAPGMAILGTQCHNLAFTNIQIAPTPRTGRLMSTCADGIHLADCTGSVDIRDCAMAGMGDDCINAHAGYLRIVHRIDNSTVLVSQPGEAPFGPQGLPVPGQAFTFSDGQTLQLLGSGKLLADAGGARARLQFSRDMPSSIRDGDLLFNLADSPRVTIANCQFSGNRARGVLAHSNAVIENCTFANQFEEALLLLPSASSTDGGAVNDTTIRGNIIEGANRAGYPSGAIRIGALAHYAGKRDYPSAAIVNRNVTIADNQIISAGADGIHVSSTGDLAIANNRIERPAGSAIVLLNVRQTTITGNTCVPPAALRIDPESVSEVTLSGNAGLTR